MENVIKNIFSEGKGILAIDERASTIHRKFEKLGIKGDEEQTFKYRNIFFETSNLEDYISGVILAEDTFKNQKTGSKFSREILKEKNISIGVKVDGGLKEYDENLSLTKGLEGLDEKCMELKKMGADFTKWRSIISVEHVTEAFLSKLSKDIAEYARISQKNGLVPIVEPELLIEGSHSIASSEQILIKTITSVINALKENGVDLKTTILKTSFVVSGSEATLDDESEMVGLLTIEALQQTAGEFGGIVFLSGGLNSTDSFSFLNEAKLRAIEVDFVTPISFSFGRALQNDALLTWNGKEENIEKAKEAFMNTLIVAQKSLKTT